ncbi:MAG: aspartate-semialdehyde dehydrogenase [Dehalococcoidia bacterium]
MAGRTYSVAVVGATGLVGREFLRILETSDFPLKSLRLLASKRSAGATMRFRGKDLPVEETIEQSFAGQDFAFVSATTEASKHWVPIAARAGSIAIDDSSAFRMDPSVPLVVPEVNAGDLDGHSRIVAIPNCSTTPLVLALWPLHQVNPVQRIIAATYQSVSGTGTAAVEELRAQSRALATNEDEEPVAEVYPYRIAFNLLPHIDGFLENGYTKEEWKMVQETRKIMHAPELPITSTCVRVPVYVCHSEAVTVEFERPMEAAEARTLLAAQPGVEVADDPARNVYPHPAAAAGKDPVYVGRIRKDASHPNGLSMFIVSDNLRKGAALNALQIAEAMAARGLV